MQRLQTLNLLLPMPILSGCLATTDLRKDPSVNEADRNIAVRIGDLTKQRCTYYQYVQDSGRKLSGDIRFSESAEVRRLYRSDSGWVKAEIVANAVWDSVYYQEAKGTLVCGEKNWQKLDHSNAIKFVSVDRRDGSAEVSVNTAPAARSAGPKKLTDDVRPIALRWDGYLKLISGTAHLSDRGLKGNVKATLPGGEGECSGLFEFTGSSSGQWAVACTNGLSATGTFESFGSGKGSAGIGTDAKGNRVEFTVGAAPAVR